MSLAKLTKVKAKRVMGVDASTHSIAFCIMEDGKVVSYGEVFFEGATVYERILDAKRKMSALKKIGLFNVDYMAIEAAVKVRSIAVALKMAYVFGAIMGEILDDSIIVQEVRPIQWQSYIGNKNWTKAQKDALKKKLPGHTVSWYSNEVRNRRKQFTLDWSKTIGITTDSDNVADAAGICFYASQMLTR